MALNPGEFQINDIILLIPPEEIRVQRQSVNNMWQTLRTKSSQKTKSGFSSIDISLTVYFTDTPQLNHTQKRFLHGYQQLQDLVAQFRVTPFCYVENSFLRDSIMSGDTTKAMALAMRQIYIETMPDSTNVLCVRLDFAWFNYLPYLPDFRFRQHIFSHKSVPPQESIAWRMFYKAEQARGDYGSVITNVSSATENIALSFTQFATYPTTLYKQLREEVDVLRKSAPRLRSLSNLEGAELSKEVFAIITENTKNQDVATGVYHNLIGSTTSMGNDESFNESVLTALTVQNVINATERELNSQTSRRYQQFLDSDEWRIIVGQLGGPLSLPHNITQTEQERKATKDRSGTVVLERKVSLKTQDHALIPIQITISFENILATLPILGHTYPTYQHIGSIDSVVTMSLTTTSSRAVRELTGLYTAFEDGAHKFRAIPAGVRNIQISNRLLNMFGLREFLTETITVAPVAGQPGTHEILLRLVDNPLTSTTRENIYPVNGINVEADRVASILKVLTKYLKPKTSVFKSEEGKAVTQAPRSSKLFVPTSGILSEMRALNTSTNIKPEELSPLFLYNNLIEKNVRKQQLYNLVQEYGLIAQKAVKGLLELLQDPSVAKETNTAVFGEDYKGTYLTDSSHLAVGMFLMNDTDLPGIEFIRDTVRQGLTYSQQYKTLADQLRTGESQQALPPSRIITGSSFGDAPVQDIFTLANRYSEATSTMSQSMSDEAKRNAEMEFQKIRSQIQTARAGQIQLKPPPRSAQVGALIQTQQEELPILEQGIISQSSAVKASAVASDFNKEGIARQLQEKNEPISIHTEQLVHGIKAAKVIAEYENELYTFIREKVFRWAIWSEEAFAEVRATIKENGISPGLVGYPDFPIKEVIEALQASTDEIEKKILKGIIEEARQPGLLTKGLGADALLNPDFYILGGLQPTDEVVDQALIQKSVAMIKASHDDARLQTEMNFIEEFYNKRVLSAQAVGAINTYSKTGYSTGHLQASDELKRSIDSSFAGQLLENRGLFAPMDFHPSIAGDTVSQCIHATLQQYDKPLIAQARKTDSPDALQAQLRTNTHFEDKELRPASDQDNIVPILTHKFGTSVLDELGALGLWRAKLEANQSTSGRPIFDRPTLMGGITSGFGERTDPITNAKKVHDGIDIGVAIGTPVHASASGVIEKIGLGGNEGYAITVDHGQGWKTKYFHLDNDVIFQEMLDRFNFAQKNNEQVFVNKGEQIASSGSTGRSTGPHLHFEIRQNGQARNPTSILNGDVYPSLEPMPKTGITRDSSILAKSVDQFEAGIRHGQGPSLMRAYPTFKLYFIESDLEERKRFGWDDFFGYSSVQEIQLIRNRKLAADLLVVQVTNISGVLSNRKFRNELDPGKPRDSKGKIVEEDPTNFRTPDTYKENPIASMLLQPGTQVQLRLGYSNNPELLDKVFNGIVTEVQFSEDDSLVNITCQSFGIEFVQSVYGESKALGGWFTNTGRTAAILQEVLAAPEVVHFGRWEPAGGGNTGRSILTNRWKFKENPVDDNIFAPTNQRGVFGLFDSTSKYIMYQTTSWDILQEMTLRHPGYICCPVPYDDSWGPRMTLFFGVPDQLYFARDPTATETHQLAVLSTAAIDSIDVIGKNAQELAQKPDLAEGERAMFAEAANNMKAENREDSGLQDRIIQSVKRELGLNRGFIRPFRNYHLLTSNMHIIHNSIMNAAHNTFNSITIQYDDSDESDIDEQRQEVSFGEPEVFNLKADAGISDEDVREGFVQYYNCRGPFMAQRYAVSLLKNSLKEGYRGSIIIIGNPSIKPYDICYVMDECNDMYGPIEVGQVVHKFSQQNGFVTEITPDMMIHVNELATMSSADAMGLIAEGVFGNVFGKMANHGDLIESAAITTATGYGLQRAGMSALGVAMKLPGMLGFGLSAINAVVNIAGAEEAAVGATGPGSLGGLVGGFIYRKLLTRTQLAHPFHYSPLVHGGKPMLGGVSCIRQTSGSFIQAAGKWFRDSKKDAGLYIDHITDMLNPNNIIGRRTGSFSAWFTGDEQQNTKVPL